MSWYHSNNLSLSIDKTNEMVVDFQRRSAAATPLLIGGSEVERASSTKFLGVHILDDLTWSINTNSAVRKAQQCLHFLWRQKRASLPPPILTTFYMKCNFGDLYTLFMGD